MRLSLKLSQTHRCIRGHICLGWLGKLSHVCLMGFVIDQSLPDIPSPATADVFRDNGSLGLVRLEKVLRQTLRVHLLVTVTIALLTPDICLTHWSKVLPANDCLIFSSMEQILSP